MRRRSALALSSELSRSWAAIPRAIEERYGRAALLLDDPGGELLSLRIYAPVDLAWLLRVGIGAAAALGELHARGIVNRDVKPANLLATESGEVRLLNFGFSARVPRQGIHERPTGAAVGTLAYMAPELTSAKGPAHRKLNGLVAPFSSVAGALASELEDRAERGELDVAALVEQLVALAPRLASDVGKVTLEALRAYAR